MKYKFTHYKITKKLLALFVLIPVLLLTLYALSQPQQLLQYAQRAPAPPLFGCLQVGEGNNVTCSSLFGQLLLTKPLMLHGRPFENQTVYYGDRLTGSLTYTNIGDLVMNNAAIGLFAASNTEDYAVIFEPAAKVNALKSKESVNLENASILFQANDPSGLWTVNTALANSDGQTVEATSGKKTFIVNATCTALRVLELTDKDKTNIKSFCKKAPNNKLCTSKQYCEIFEGQGPNCSKPNVSQEIPKKQCDKSIVLDKPEQDILEELCKVHPDTDACDRFCMRTIGSSLCPKRYLWFDKQTGKELVPQPKIIKEPQVLGIQTTAQAATKTLLADGPLRNAPGCSTNCLYTGKPDPAPPPSAPAPPPPAPPAKKPAPAARCTFGIGAGCPSSGRPQAPPLGKTLKNPLPAPQPVTCEANLPEGCCKRATCRYEQLPVRNFTYEQVRQNGRRCAFDSSRTEDTGFCVTKNDIGDFLEGAVLPTPRKAEVAIRIGAGLLKSAWRNAKEFNDDQR